MQVEFYYYYQLLWLLLAYNGTIEITGHDYEILFIKKTILYYTQRHLADMIYWYLSTCGNAGKK